MEWLSHINWQTVITVLAGYVASALTIMYRRGRSEAEQFLVIASLKEQAQKVEALPGEFKLLEARLKTVEEERAERTRLFERLTQTLDEHCKDSTRHLDPVRDHRAHEELMLRLAKIDGSIDGLRAELARRRDG